MDKSKNKILVGCLALLLVMAVGYALFSENITINGTATAKGDFEITITEALIEDEKGSSGATATITDNGKSLKLSIPNLEYPGAYVKVKYKVKNTGTIPALFSSRTMSGITLDEYDSLQRIRIAAPLSNLFYEPGDVKEEEFTISWDKDDRASTMEENISITYDISFVQVSDKAEACSKLNTLKNDLLGCIIGGNECFDEQMDITGDTYVENSDITFLTSSMRSIGCPSN